MIRDAFIPMLLKHNIQTIGEAGHGKELLKILGVEKKIPDIILLDIEMPIMDGSEALNHLKKDYPDIKVIMLTQYLSKEMATHFISRGARAYVDKGCDFEVLIQAIKSVKEFGFYYNNFPEMMANISTKKNQQPILPKPKYSNRETDVIPFLVDGLKSKEVAEILSVEKETIEFHRKNILKKTNLKTTIKFIKHALQEGYNYFRR